MPVALAGAPAVTLPLRASALRLRLVLAALAAAAGWISRPPPPDMTAFAAAGQHILDGRFGLVYAGDWNQAGPLQLLASRALLPAAHAGSPAPWLLALGNAGLLLAALAVARDARRPAGRPRCRRDLLVGAVLLLWFASGAPWNGHPVEILIPLSWIAAVRARPAAPQRRPPSPASPWALAVAPWAVLGVPSLLAGARPARAAAIGALGIGAGMLAYLPFVWTGHFHLLGHAWPVAPGSLVHLLDPHLQRATWAFRLGQAVVVGGGCAALAVAPWRHRPRPPPRRPRRSIAVLLRIAHRPVADALLLGRCRVCAVVLLAAVPGPAPAGDRGRALVAYGCWAAPGRRAPADSGRRCASRSRWPCSPTPGAPPPRRRPGYSASSRSRSTSRACTRSGCRNTNRL